MDKVISFKSSKYTVNEFLEKIDMYELVTETCTPVYQINLDYCQSYNTKNQWVNKYETHKLVLDYDRLIAIIENRVCREFHDNKLLTIAEASRLTNLSTRTIYRKIREKALKSILIDTSRRIKITDLMTFIDLNLAG